jgi:NarL family two-component system response regulator LiaR
MIFLIAEDSSRMRASIKQFISTRIPNHHTVYEASDGRSAVDLYERAHPDWVLMDIRMEPIDGLAASRTILAAHPDAKIIILTNYDDERYRSAAKEAGVRAFLLKEHLNEVQAILTHDLNG